MFGDTPKSHATSVVLFPFIPSIACIPARSAAVLTTLCEPTRGPGYVAGSRTFPVLRYTSIHRFALRHVVWAAFAMLRMLPFLFFLYFAMMRQRPSNVRPVDLLLDGMLLLRRSGKWVRESDGGATWLTLHLLLIPWQASFFLSVSHVRTHGGQRRIMCVSDSTFAQN